jgi:hypothetical protein
MEYKYLLGATNDGEIVFGEFGISNRNGCPEFTASFEKVQPFSENDADDAEEYYENLIDEMDGQEKWNLCKENDLRPSELAEWIADNRGREPQDIHDCSLYPEIIDVDGTNWYFESRSCGQHDTRGEMTILVSANCYDRLHDLWDKYHLKRVDESVISEVQNLSKCFESCFEGSSQEEWIADYIRTHND